MGVSLHGTPWTARSLNTVRHNITFLQLWNCLESAKCHPLSTVLEILSPLCHMPHPVTNVVINSKNLIYCCFNSSANVFHTLVSDSSTRRYHYTTTMLGAVTIAIFCCHLVANAAGADLSQAGICQSNSCFGKITDITLQKVRTILQYIFNLF